MAGRGRRSSAEAPLEVEYSSVFGGRIGSDRRIRMSECIGVTLVSVVLSSRLALDLGEASRALLTSACFCCGASGLGGLRSTQLYLWSRTRSTCRLTAGSLLVGSSPCRSLPPALLVALSDLTSTRLPPRSVVYLFGPILSVMCPSSQPS